MDDYPFIGYKRLQHGNWAAFERMIERAFIHHGLYKTVELTGKSHDGGADVLAISKDNKIEVSQVKYSDQFHPLNSSVLDELVNGMHLYDADIGNIVTNRKLSNSFVNRLIQMTTDANYDIKLYDSSNILKFGEILTDFSSEFFNKPLRSYQEEAFESIKDMYLSNNPSTWFSMATGLGKTRVAAQVIMDWFERYPDSEVLILVPYETLIHQIDRALWPYLSKYIHTHYLYANEKPEYSGGVTIGTYASFQSWVKSNSERYDLIICDEAHYAPAPGNSNAIKLANPKFLLGMTATPFRGDKKTLDSVFGNNCFEMSIVKGMQMGYLSNTDYEMFTDSIDWDYIENNLDKHISIKELNRTLFVPERDLSISEKMIDYYKKQLFSQGIVFCPSIIHAEKFSSTLNALGMKSAAYHSDLDKKIKTNNLKSFFEKKITVLVTVDALNEGYDLPHVDLVVFLKATHSRRIFLQQLGRGLRISEGKERVLVLDFVSDLQRIFEGLNINSEAKLISNENGKEKQLVFPDGDIINFSSSRLKSFSDANFGIDWQLLSEVDINKKFKVRDLFPELNTELN